MKSIFTFIMIFFSSLMVSLAQGKLKFEEENFDFGKIEEGTQATHEFKFKNEGNAPIIISHVQASCGCTTPNWTKDPVPPGGTGIIKASFNSSGRPGVFHKSITITSNAETSSNVIFIKGMVIAESGPSEKLVFSSTTIDAGKIGVGQKVTKNIEVTNNGKTPISFVKATSPCNCIYIKGDEAIAPGKKGAIELTYIPKSTGYMMENIKLQTNEPGVFGKISLRADVEALIPTIMKEGKTNVPFN